MYRTVAGSPLRSVSTSRSRAENVESFKTGTRRFDCLVASRLARVGTQPSIKPPCNDHRHPNHLRSANSGPRNRSALGMNPAPAQCVQHLENSRCNQQLRHDRTALLRCIRSRDPTRSGRYRVQCQRSPLQPGHSCCELYRLRWSLAQLRVDDRRPPVSSYCSDHLPHSRPANRIGSNRQTACIRIFASLSLLTDLQQQCPPHPIIRKS
jgi:hypothetical protein